MASDLIVPVVEVTNVRPHPNADMLSIAEVLGYQVVNGLVEDPEGETVRHFVAGDEADEFKRDERGRPIPCSPDDEEILKTDGILAARYSFRYKNGDKGVYFPADTVLSDELAERFNVKHLLKSGNRVSRTRLRGEPSFGLVVELPEGVNWKVGQNVAEHYDVKKYTPPPRNDPGDIAEYASEVDPFFVKYTDIQNGLLLYDKFQEGEEVIATEKIHGANCRIGIVNGTFVAGSRTTRKVDPAPDCGETEEDLKVFKDYLFWSPVANPGVRKLLFALAETGAKTVILFGEVYGQGVQSLHYGVGGKKAKGFRAFDVYVDGEYMDFHGFADLCDLHGVERAPVLFQGPFDLEKIKEVSNGRSTLPGADNIREGVVVRPAVERRDPALGRVVLKFISPQYDLSKHKKKDTTDL